jgi:hypothetical protein
MVTKVHGCGPREGRKKKINLEMDLELNEVRAIMENLAFKMYKDVRAH